MFLFFFWVNSYSPMLLMIILADHITLKLFQENTVTLEIEHHRVVGDQNNKSKW